MADNKKEPTISDGISELAELLKMHGDIPLRSYPAFTSTLHPARFRVEEPIDGTGKCVVCG